jgi:uncharacterized membrane protein YadS
MEESIRIVARVVSFGLVRVYVTGVWIHSSFVRRTLGSGRGTCGNSAVRLSEPTAMCNKWSLLLATSTGATLYSKIGKQ